MSTNQINFKPGTKVGFLTILRIGTPGGMNRRHKWLCRCICGNEKEIDSSNLKRGNTRSCGCFGKMFKDPKMLVSLLEGWIRFEKEAADVGLEDLVERTKAAIEYHQKVGSMKTSRQLKEERRRRRASS